MCFDIVIRNYFRCRIIKTETMSGNARKIYVKDQIVEITLEISDEKITSNSVYNLGIGNSETCNKNDKQKKKHFDS